MGDGRFEVPEALAFGFSPIKHVVDDLRPASPPPPQTDLTGTGGELHHGRAS